MRTRVPVIPANGHERRIIALENFMLSTPLRGVLALAAFNEHQRIEDAKPPKPLVPPDPGGRMLRKFLADLLADIHAMRRMRGVCVECGDANCPGGHA
jgi:hypothetical protein